MNKRKTIPNRRQHEIISFNHDGTAFIGSVSFVDNQPMEIFLEGAKNGSSMQAAARDMAVAASIALQYGAPLDVIRQALTRNHDGKPAGPLGSMLDRVAE